MMVMLSSWILLPLWSKPRQTSLGDSLTGGSLSRKLIFLPQNSSEKSINPQYSVMARPTFQMAVLGLDTGKKCTRGPLEVLAGISNMYSETK